MKVEILSNRRVFDGFFKVDEATLRYERFDGRMSDVVARLNLERGDSVAAIIVNIDTEHVILVSQFKFPTYAKGPGWLTEALAGTIEPGEDARGALVREAMEEAGYLVTNAEPIGAPFYVTPGGSSERINLWYVEVRNSDKRGPGRGAVSEGEDIRLVEFPVSEIDSLIEGGTIVDAKTLVGLMWLQRRRARTQREPAK